MEIKIDNKESWENLHALLEQRRVDLDNRHMVLEEWHNTLVKLSLSIKAVQNEHRRLFLYVFLAGTAAGYFLGVIM